MASKDSKYKEALFNAYRKLHFAHVCNVISAYLADATATIMLLLG